MPTYSASLDYAVPAAGALVGNAEALSFQFAADVSYGLDANAVLYIDGQLAYSGGAFQSGFTGTATPVLPGSGGIFGMTFLITSHPVFRRPKVDVLFSTAGTGTPRVFASFSYRATLGDVSNLVAKSHPEGKRIDLSWALPSGVAAVRVRRSTIGYPRYVDDPGVDVYLGAPITKLYDGVNSNVLLAGEAATQTALAENQFYYYTVFISFIGTPYLWLSGFNAEVQGLSIRDYFAAEGDYVFDLLPREVRRQDGDPARGSERHKMRYYVRGTLQAGVNLLRGYNEATLLMRDPDLMPAGRVGDASAANVNNYGFLQAQNWDYGIAAGRTFDAATLRRLAFGLVAVYQQKGTCAGAAALAKIVTTWDAACSEMAEPYCGVQHLAYFWDGASFITQSRHTLAANNANVSIPGRVTIPTTQLYAWDNTSGASLDVTNPPAFVIDALGTYACVSSVDAPSGGSQVVRFVDPNAILRREITGTGTSATGLFTITNIDTGSYPWQFPSGANGEPVFGQGAFVGYWLMDSAGKRWKVSTSNATSLGQTVLSLSNPLGNSGYAATGAFSIAFDFDPAGTTYAGRIPLFRAKLYTGEFTLTYDPLWDTRLLDEVSAGPWALISSFNSGVTSYWAPTPDDVVIVSQNGQADTGRVASFTRTSVQDTTKSWTVDAYRNFYVLPDWNQRRVFRIVGNTATDLVCDVPSSVGGLDKLVHVGSYYVIMSERDAIRYTNLMSLLPSFLPS